MEGFWVCKKDIGTFKAGTICEVFNPKLGDRLVKEKGGKVGVCFPWEATKDNFTWCFGDSVRIPYKYAEKSLGNFIRYLFKRPQKLVSTSKYIEFETDSKTRQKIQEKIIVYIVCIDRDILIEFNEMLTRHLNNLKELCRYTTDIDEEINSIHKIIFELFEFSKNATKYDTQDGVRVLHNKLKLFRGEYKKDLANSLDLVKILNSSERSIKH